MVSHITASEVCTIPTAVVWYHSCSARPYVTPPFSISLFFVKIVICCIPSSISFNSVLSLKSIYNNNIRLFITCIVCTFPSPQTERKTNGSKKSRGLINPLLPEQLSQPCIMSTNFLPNLLHLLFHNLFQNHFHKRESQHNQQCNNTLKSQ